MSYKKHTRVINVRVPTYLIEILDSLVREGYFTNKSEAVRFFIRKYLNEVSQKGGENIE